MYITRDREAGNMIDRFNTKEEAEKAIAYYEYCDKQEGIFTPDFYEVAEEEQKGKKEMFTLLTQEVQKDNARQIKETAFFIEHGYMEKWADERGADLETDGRTVFETIVKKYA